MEVVLGLLGSQALKYKRPDDSASNNTAPNIYQKEL
jgi:hypothetical protein